MLRSSKFNLLKCPARVALYQTKLSKNLRKYCHGTVVNKLVKQNNINEISLILIRISHNCSLVPYWLRNYLSHIAILDLQNITTERSLVLNRCSITVTLCHIMLSKLRKYLKLILQKITTEGNLILTKYHTVVVLWLLSKIP